MMAHFRLDPASVLPLHSHPHAQFGVFLEGGGEFRVGDSVWRMKKGDSYYIPPGVPHELRVGGDGAVVVDFFVPERQDYHTQLQDPESD
jgi:quercetin dioxygenase-like cupin family protein